MLHIRAIYNSTANIRNELWALVPEELGLGGMAEVFEYFFQQSPLSFYQWNQGPNTLKQTKSVFTDPHTKSTWIPWVHRPQIEKHWAKENILLAVSSIGDMTYSSAMLILSVRGEGSACTCAHSHTYMLYCITWGVGVNLKTLFLRLNWDFLEACFCTYKGSLPGNCSLQCLSSELWKYQIIRLMTQHSIFQIVK